MNTLSNLYDEDIDNIETYKGLETLLNEWLEDIEGPFDEDSYKSVEKGEFKSRDGFIPYSHNKGSIDLIMIQPISHMLDSGMVPSVIEDRVNECYEYSLDCIQEDNPELNKEQVSDAYFEESSDYDEIAFRVRCMYEGKGVLMVYAGYDFDAPYFRWNEKALFEKEVKFSSIEDLKKQLNNLLPELEKEV